MSDDYTPTTEQVRVNFASDRCADEGVYAPQAMREFDRWLAAHDAQKRAEWEAEQSETEWERLKSFEQAMSEALEMIQPGRFMRPDEPGYLGTTRDVEGARRVIRDAMRAASVVA